MHKAAIVARLAACFLLVSCSFNEPRIRSEPVILQQGQNPVTVVLSDQSHSALDLQCEEVTPWFTRKLGAVVGGTAGNECVYEVVTEESLDRALVSTDKAVRRNAVLKVLYLSDRSCDNFRASVFAFRTGANYASGLFTTLFSGTSAITALFSGPAASALSATNLAQSSALNGLNSSYYANKMIDQLDAEMEARRQELKSQILARMQAAPPQEGEMQPAAPAAKPTPTPAVKPYTGLDAEIDLQAYDNLCSLETLTRSSLTPTPTATPTTTPTPTATPTPMLKLTLADKFVGKYSGSGAVAAKQTLHLENPKSTGKDVTVSEIAWDAKTGNKSEFQVPQDCAKKFKAGDPECTETITFTPTSVDDAVVADLTIKSDAPGTAPASTLHGTVRSVGLKASPTKLTCKKGQPSQDVTLTNPDANLTIKITDVHVTGPFAIASGWTNSPIAVPPGQHHVISIQCPAAPGKNTGKLTVSVDSASNKKQSRPIDLEQAK